MPIPAVMEADVTSRIGAGLGERNLERLTHRNGYRPAVVASLSNHAHSSSFVSHLYYNREFSSLTYGHGKPPYCIPLSGSLA